MRARVMGGQFSRFPLRSTGRSPRSPAKNAESSELRKRPVVGLSISRIITNRCLSSTTHHQEILGLFTRQSVAKYSVIYWGDFSRNPAISGYRNGDYPPLPSLRLLALSAKYSLFIWGSGEGSCANVPEVFRKFPVFGVGGVLIGSLIALVRSLDSAPTRLPPITISLPIRPHHTRFTMRRDIVAAETEQELFDGYADFFSRAVFGT